MGRTGPADRIAGQGGDPMTTGKKWNLVIDLSRCMDCNDCFLADKDEFVGNDFLPYSVAQPWHGHRWMNIERKERGKFPLVKVAYLPLPCLHCDEAPCIEKSPPGTVYKRADGLVIIDPVKAKGHREIVDTCPYEVIYWNEEAQVAQKCTGCAHLIDEGWTETRCSQVCPAEAIRLVFADDAEMAQTAAAEGLEVLRPELGARPRVYYKNLYLWTKAFIAGSVVFGDTDECAEGAKAVVTREGRVVGEAIASNYGDFYVDRLEPGGRYVLAVEAVGYRPVTMEVDLEQSVNVGTLTLERA
jgi:Fe-S-cluster-containing dehydrogenase component